MGSTRCRHFVQNAWKKDLCSNCFKSRDEHAAAAPPARPAPSAAAAGPPPQGILRGATGSWARKKSHKVYFPAEECEVIGEGGEDAGPPSDDDDRHDDDDDDWSAPAVDDDPREREEEKLLQALTRSNTDFNSVAANLLEGPGAPAPPPDPRKAAGRAPLQLGKPLKDSEGKKQTLLVSVQPFGGKPHVTKIHTADIAMPEKLVQITTAPAKQSSDSSKSNGVQLKSITRTCSEFSDTTSPLSLKVPSNTSIGVVAEVKSESTKSVVVAPSDSGAPPVRNGLLNGASASPTQSPPVLKTAPTQTRDAEVVAEKTQVSPKLSPPLQISSKHIFLKSIVDGGAVESPAPVSKSSPEASPTITTSPAPVNSTAGSKQTQGQGQGVYMSPVRQGREGKRTHITRATPISKSNELLLKTKFIPLRTSAILNKNNGSNELALNKQNNNNHNINNKVEALKNERNSEADVVVGFQLQPREVVLKVSPPSSKPLESSSDEEDYVDAEHTYSNVQVEPEGVQTKRLSSLLAATLSVGSRELAGEPDGRADPDPDSSSESSGGEQPPALPQSPPPAVDPRPSFLHGLTARIAAADKPKVPFKSSSVVQRWAQSDKPVPPPQPPPAEETADPPQAPDCSPPHTPQGSPEDSPQGSPPSSPQGSPQGSGDTASRSHKRQAPKPPQTPSEEPPELEPVDTTPLFYSRNSHPSLTASSPSPCEESSSGSGSSSVNNNNSSSSNNTKNNNSISISKRRGRDRILGLGLGPMRSESVPSALGQVALGQSVTLGARSGHSIAQALAQSAPQPSPRRALSLSTDSLSETTPKHIISYDTERKKVGTKVRFSLRKFLGLTKEGVREELDATHALSHPAGAGEAVGAPQPRPRPRLEIIHPSDLSGNAVEVLRGSGLEVRRQLQEAAQAAHRRSSESSGCPGTPVTPGATATPPHSSTAEQADRDATKGRPTKPPPPPRSQSLDSDRTDTASIGRPSRPPPPKTSDLLRRQKQPPSPPVPPAYSVYANLGEARSAVAPLKPQRTGSVRDASIEGPKRTPLVADKEKESKQESQGRAISVQVQPEDSGYESVELSDTAQPHSMTDSENVYECVNGAERSSSPECDSKRPGPGSGSAHTPCAPARYAQHRRSEGSDVIRPEATDYPRLGFSSFGRPASVPYCGSETESDIYSPYSFYGSEEGDDGDGDMSLPPSASQASWKWRRKGRSVVHKSMEDNYGAVVGANHEALAQLLEQIRTGPSVPPPLRPLKALSSLSWRDFSLEAGAAATAVGRWVFLPAQWGAQAVTLSVLPDCSPAGVTARPPARRGRGPFALMPIAEFRDFVPTSCLPQAQRPPAPGNHVQAYVGVLARVRVETLSSYGAWLQSQDAAVGAEDVWREAGVALLQLVNALKSLQAMGTEEASTDSIVFLRDHAAAGAAHTAQLAMLYTLSAGPEEEDGSRSLCQCALVAAQRLLPSAPTFDLLTSLLGKERAESLSRAKSVLEFWLWGPGPGDNAPSLGPASTAGREKEREREAALQRWLDLERATVLHRLVCARAAAYASGPSHRLAIHQQSHLLFLVHTSAKTMCDASQLLDSHSVSPLEPCTF